MNFIQLEYFKKTAELESVSAAAKKLFVSQPAVSKQIKLLEEELDCKLFSRKNNKLKLSSEGKLLLAHASEILSKVANLKHELDLERNLISGRLVIGCGPLTARAQIPDAVKKMLKAHPSVEISIFETYWTEIAPLLKNDSIDIGIGPEVKEDGIAFEKLFSSRLVLLCHKSSPLASKKEISPEDLRTEALTGYPPDSAVYHALEEAGFSGDKKYILQTKYHGTIIAYVEKGIGVGILPEYILKYNKPGKDSIIKPLSESVYINIGINVEKEKHLSPAARRFIEILKESVTE